ncbi:MAG: hypothetical protein ACOVOV_01590 [Dolichospermum sp.]
MAVQTITTKINKLQKKIAILTARLKACKFYRLACKYAVQLTVLEGILDKLIAKVYRPADNFIYSLTTVCHVLKVGKEMIQAVWQKGKDATVQMIDGSTVELKLFDAQKAMGELRKARSRSLTVTRDLFDGSKFTVRNETSDSLYSLECKDDHVECECVDYQNLVNKFNTNKVSCKHCYGVLNELGYGTLQDYVKDIKQVRVAAKIADVDRFIPKSNDSYSVVGYEARMDY